MRPLGLIIVLVAMAIGTQTLPKLMRLSRSPPSLINGAGPEALLNWIIMIVLLFAVTVIPAALGIHLMARRDEEHV